MDFVDRVENSKAIRLSKALAPLSIVIAVIGLLISQFDRYWNIADRDLRLLDRAVKIIEEKKPLDRRIGSALSLLASQGYYLSGIDLSSSSETNVMKANNAKLAGINMQGSDFSGSEFRWTDFRRSYLDGADFSGTSLAWADFTGAKLSEAKFVNTDLQCVDLTGTDLRWVDFSGASFGEWTGLGCDVYGLVEGQLKEAYFWDDNPPEYAPIWIMNELSICDSNGRAEFDGHFWPNKCSRAKDQTAEPTQP